MSRLLEQELSAGCHYEPLPSLPEAPDTVLSPELAGGEGYEWAAPDNLDAFFTKVYRYWQDKGLTTIMASRLLNLAALAFTIAFSALLLLWVNWGALLHSSCLQAPGTAAASAPPAPGAAAPAAAGAHPGAAGCSPLSFAVYSNPLAERSVWLLALAGCYLSIFGAYWVWAALHFVADMRSLRETRHFYNNKLGISDRQVAMMTWSEVAHRLVLVQRSTRLCAARDLAEPDIVGRIMRKENYLIAMLSSGVLALHVPSLGGCLRCRRFMLTKTLEWNLYWCILDPMFDDAGFHVRQEFLADEEALKRRLRLMAAANALLSPFLLLFLVIYFFMKNAERFYHSPGSIGARRWSSLAKWRLREFNELPHYVQHRMDSSHKAAAKYLSQFPSPLLSQAAKFVSFVAGSIAALLLALSLLDERLLEAPLLAGHALVWWIAMTGIVLTTSRAFISDLPVAPDPEAAMAELALATHYLPRHWRGRAHTAEVRDAVSSLYPFKMLAVAEELASVVLAPLILSCSLPRCAGSVLEFVRDNTVRVPGVGDICSLSAFDFQRHGNPKYGAPAAAPSKALRSKQGKMEKSFLTFVATYPTWQPSPAGRAMLSALSAHADDVAMTAAAASAGGSLLGSFSAVPLTGGSAVGGGGSPSAAHPPPGAVTTSLLYPHQQQQQQRQAGGAGVLSPRPPHPPAASNASSAYGLPPIPSPTRTPSHLLRSPAAAAASSPGGGGRHARAPAPQLPPLQQHYQQHQQQQPQQQQQHPQQHPQQQHPLSQSRFQPAPPHPLLRVFPSTLYPGGPSAGALLSQLHASCALGAAQGAGAFGASHAFGAVSGGSGSAAASGFHHLPLAAAQQLPAGGDTDGLGSRLALSHSVLQSFYESQEVTVQHRLQNRQHARSALLGMACGAGASMHGAGGAATLAASAGDGGATAAAPSGGAGGWATAPLAGGLRPGAGVDTAPGAPPPLEPDLLMPGGHHV